MQRRAVEIRSSSPPHLALLWLTFRLSLPQPHARPLAILILADLSHGPFVWREKPVGIVNPNDGDPDALSIGERLEERVIDRNALGEGGGVRVLTKDADVDCGDDRGLGGRTGAHMDLDHGAIRQSAPVLNYPHHLLGPIRSDHEGARRARPRFGQ